MLKFVHMLNDRSHKVLRAVVQCYIQRPGPVGSRYVTKKYAFNLSSATIRNIMADLEEMGFLAQPHTSAGRVPTDKGFRFYVDSLGESPAPEAESRARYLAARLAGLTTGISEMLIEATQVLSALSKCLVFAMPVSSDKTTLNRIQLFRYLDSQLVAVILSNEGLVRNRVLGSNLGLSQRDLNRISDYLNAEFSGWGLDDIRVEILRQMSEEKAACDVLIKRAMSIFREAISFPADDLLIISGLPELLSLPDFSDRINDIVRAMEDKRSIVDLIDELSYGAEGVQVAIGSEIPTLQLRGMSIVSSAYKQGDRPLGRLGIIGPVRMDYSATIPMVEQAAKFISAAISR